MPLYSGIMKTEVSFTETSVFCMRGAVSPPVFGDAILFFVGTGVPHRPWVAHKTKLSLQGEAVAIRNTRKRKIRILHSVQNDTLVAKKKRNGTQAVPYVNTVGWFRFFTGCRGRHPLRTLPPDTSHKRKTPTPHVYELSQPRNLRIFRRGGALPPPVWVILPRLS